MQVKTTRCRAVIGYRRGQDKPMLSARDCRFLLTTKFRRKKRHKGVECHIINPLLTKLVQSRWLDISLVLRNFAFLCTSTSSRSMKTQKENFANIQLSWTHTWSIIDIYIDLSFILVWQRMFWFIHGWISQTCVLRLSVLLLHSTLEVFSLSFSSIEFEQVGMKCVWELTQ